MENLVHPPLDSHDIPILQDSFSRSFIIENELLVISITPIKYGRVSFCHVIAVHPEQILCRPLHQSFLS